REAALRAVEGARRFVAREPSAARPRTELAYCLDIIGQVEGGAGDWKAAAAACEESLRLEREVLELEPGFGSRRNVYASLASSVQALRKAGDAKLAAERLAE